MKREVRLKRSFIKQLKDKIDLKSVPLSIFDDVFINFKNGCNYCKEKRINSIPITLKDLGLLSYQKDNTKTVFIEWEK